MVKVLKKDILLYQHSLKLGLYKLIIKELIYLEADLCKLI